MIPLLLIFPFRKNAHSVCAGPSSSRPTPPSFLFLLHVASFPAEHWLLIFPAFWGAGPPFTPLLQADPISLRSQATARFHVRYTYNSQITPLNSFEFFFEYAEIFIFKCCSAGFDTPQDFVPRCLIPRRTLLSRVSDPAGCCPAGYQTLQNKCLL